VISTIGQPVGRVDGPAKVTGRAKYAADFPVPGTLATAVLRSPHPHARIVHVDASRARAVPGVRAVLIGQDLEGRLYGRAIADMPILAFDRVRHIGEPVAAAAAETREAAEEALRLIDIEYEPLPAVFDPFAAMQQGAPILHPRFRDYRRLGTTAGWVGGSLGAAQPEIPNLVSNELVTNGNVEAGFGEADLVLEHTYTTARQHQGYIEPNSCIVQAEPDGTLRIWASNKTPFTARQVLALDLEMPEQAIVFEHTYVGGDFGGKGFPLQIPLGRCLSQATGRPVRLLLGAVEEMIAADPSHASWITVRSGLKRDGTLTARQVKVVFDSGGYAGIKPVAGGILSAALFQSFGVYRIPHFSFEARMVYTNNLPCGFMRLPGGAQVAYACEADMDRLAEAVGLEPLEFRLRNGLRDGEPNAIGEQWTGIRLEECLRTVDRAAGLREPRPAGVGRGLSVAQEASGGGISESTVEVHPDGTTILITSVSDQGSGAYTILSQIVAHELQLPLERVKLDLRGTANGPWDRGSSAQSVTRIAGNATVQAAGQVRDKLATVAAEYLGCRESQVRLEDARFFDPDQPGRSLTFDEIAQRACRGGQPVSASSRYEVASKSHETSFVAQVAEVEVDRDTGQVYVHRLICVADVGTVLNPIGLTGQIEGGAIMALGMATMEELKVDATGRVETAGLNDYKLPTVVDIPKIETILITGADGPGPYGAKAVGELGVVGVPAAIVNAIHDATGIRITDLPVTAEKVRAALKAQADQ